MINIKKNALVTGAASGIGRSIATGLAHAGATVAIHYHSSASEAVALSNELTAQGCNAMCLQADLRDANQIEKLATEIQNRTGGLDILVNNAGIAFSRIPVSDIEIGKWRDLFAVNLDAPFLLSKMVLPGMRAQRWGRIVNIGSNSVKVQSPGAGAYVASKAALHALTAVVAKEEGRNNILINTVAPGFADTDMGRASLARRSPSEAQSLVDAIPLRRLCTPDDVANLVLFLCSDKADYITGQTYFINGGDRIETFNLPEHIFRAER